MYHKILEQLQMLEEEEYREFSSRLLPNVSGVRGIRLPFLRKIANEISRGDVLAYFSEVKHLFFEETLLMGFVIGTMDTKTYPIETIIAVVQAYVPYINNWSTCDSFCSSLKIAKKEPDRVFEFLMEYAVYEDETMDDLNLDQREYELRFFIVMCLNYYLNDDYIDQVLPRLRKIKTSRYYVNMALAWCYSKIFLSYPYYIIDMLIEGKEKTKSELTKEEIFIHNKTISKICDSFKVSSDIKKQIREYLI